MNILLIEDEDDIRSSVATFLTSEGYSVSSTGQRKEAFKMIEEQNFDLVITDIMLPFAGGFDIVDHIKTHPTKGGIPVIIISGMDEDVLLSTRTKADACLVKPFTFKQLAFQIKKLAAATT